MFSLNESVEVNNSNTEQNIISDNFQSVVSLSSTVNSLGTVYGESIISVDNVTYKESYIQFNDFLFYSWDRKVDENTLRKIADSVEFID